MKRIALFCDGTWNDPNDPNPTNVYWLYESTAQQEGQQEAHYFSGVGVDENKITGGVWGRGLDGKVVEAYKKLCERYELGDKIYLFGFSRGAYTARSLCGLIRKCGVLKPEHIARADEAMQLYRRRENQGPDSPNAQSFRSAYASAYVHPSLIELPLSQGRPQDAAKMLRVTYLGVWDTVGALGVPERVPLSSMINQRHRFHDSSLSKCVEWARHAVAIDETRNAFSPTLWSEESIAAINNIHREFRVEQDWFPGNHGSVGGGGEHRKLSDAALLWIAEGAERAGLALDDAKGHIARARADADPVTGPLRNSERDNWMMKLRGEGPRTVAGIPRFVRDLNDGTLKRIRDNQAYLGENTREVQWRKATLASVLSALNPDRD